MELGSEFALQPQNRPELMPKTAGRWATIANTLINQGHAPEEAQKLANGLTRASLARRLRMIQLNGQDPAQGGPRWPVPG